MDFLRQAISSRRLLSACTDHGGGARRMVSTPQGRPEPGLLEAGAGTMAKPYCTGQSGARRRDAGLEPDPHRAGRAVRRHRRRNEPFIRASSLERMAEHRVRVDRIINAGGIPQRNEGR